MLCNIIFMYFFFFTSVLLKTVGQKHEKQQIILNYKIVKSKFLRLENLVCVFY